jgi:hypothetical protein
MDTAQKFYDSVEANPVPYTALLDSYTILPLPAPPNYIDLQHQKDILQQCAYVRDNDIQALNNVDYILANPDQFVNPDLAALGQLRGVLQGDLDRIAQAASHALNFPKEAAFPSLQAGAIELPPRIAGGGAPPGPIVLVTIPNWGNMADIDQGTGDGSDTAARLGLKIASIEDDSVTVGSQGDILSITPPVGTVVPSGTTVTVRYSRNMDPANQ